MKKLLFIVSILLCLFGIGMYISVQDPVKINETGILVAGDGSVKTFRAGERAKVIPGLERYVAVSKESQKLLLAGPDAVLVYTPQKEEILVEMKMSFKILDPVAVVKEYGTEAPSALLRRQIIETSKSMLQTSLEEDVSVLIETLPRVMLIGTIHAELNEMFSPKGVAIDNLELSAK